MPKGSEIIEDDIQFIIDYLGSHNIARIAVADGQMPLANTVFYVSDGIKLYFSSSPDSRKIHVLGSNPQISLTVDEDYEDWSKIKGIEITGRALILGEGRSQKQREMFTAKFSQLRDFGGIPNHHVIVEVIPEKICYLDYEESFGTKRILHIEKKKSLLSW